MKRFYEDLTQDEASASLTVSSSKCVFRRILPTAVTPWVIYSRPSRLSVSLRLYFHSAEFQQFKCLTFPTHASAEKALAQGEFKQIANAASNINGNANNSPTLAA